MVKKNILTLVMFGMVLFLGVSNVQAEYWTSSSPGNWTDGANWNTGAEPGAGVVVEMGVGPWHGTATLDTDGGQLSNLRGSANGNPTSDYTYLDVATGGALDVGYLQVGYWNNTSYQSRFSVSGGAVNVDTIQDGGGGSYRVDVSAGTMNVVNQHWSKVDSHSRDFNISGGSLNFNGGVELNNETISVSDTGHLNIGGSRFYTGAQGSGDFTLNVSGNGSFTRDGGSELSIQSSSNTTINISDNADLDFSANCIIAYSGTGVLNMSGGTLDVGGTLGVGWNGGSSGTVNLSGGTITPNNINFSAGSFIDITGGQIVLSTDWSNWVTDKVNNGYIIGYGGTGTVEWDVSGGLTTITAVPEPATLTLLGLGAFAALRKRRK